MSTSLRIEELKKKFDENPRRYFAPLANEYRKAGDLQQAIAICQAHLPQQPGHMSGHIVYGQALFEAREFAQARTVFETALALDPENLIALRYLGDIAFELGDRGSARGWYTRVLETDPRNEEIAALMAAMGDDQGSTSRDAAPERAAAAAPQSADGPPVQQGGPAQGAVPVKETAREADAAPVGGQSAESPPATSTTDAELERLFSRPGNAGAASSGQSAPPAPQPTPQPSTFSPVSDFAPPARAERPPSLEQPAPPLGERAPGKSNAAGGAGALDGTLARPTFESQRGDDAPLQNPPAAAGAAASAPPPGPAVPRDSGFVTETMAELYVKQGFHDRALDVYRQLIAQNPADRGLRERMERIERDLRGGAVARSAGTGVGGGAAARSGPRDGAAGVRGGPTIRQFLAGIGSRGVTGRGPGVVPPPGGGPRTSGEFRVPPDRPARAATGSIDALFAGAAPSREDVAAAAALAEAFPSGGASSADAPMGGRPAHPAATELSLDHVFRDGGAAAGRGASTVSYDQFFSQPAHGGRHGSDDASAGTAPAAGSDDIEQFNAWLQGLKKR